jgi:hypothetical protein
VFYRKTYLFPVTAAFAFAFWASESSAQFQGGGGRSVGGVVVEATGVIRSATVDEQNETLAAMRQSIRAAEGELAEATAMRMISLSKLQQSLAESEQSGQPIPDDMKYLAGIQRVEYVFVYPDQQDIVIAGPAEPWRLAKDGAVVGINSGLPVVTLDDLVVAFRSVETARREGLTCSIEPTPEGSQRLQKLFSTIKLRPGQDPKVFEPAMREAFGPQLIKLTGVAKDSRYARTLVAADYQMKRIAMELDKSPVRELPSYLAISNGKRHSGSTNPRWWMACNYDAMSRTEDKLAWKLAGQGIKTLTETDAIGKDGTKTRGVVEDPLAQKWADTMTEHFVELAKAQPVFGELRNCIDLSVVATLIAQERLAESADCDLSYLVGAVDTEKYRIPQTVDPQCSFVRGRAGWVVSASGGVDVNAFEVVQNQQTAPELAEVREKASTGEPTRWWWNG